MMYKVNPEYAKMLSYTGPMSVVLSNITVSEVANQIRFQHPEESNSYDRAVARLAFIHYQSKKEKEEKGKKEVSYPLDEFFSIITELKSIKKLIISGLIFLLIWFLFALTGHAQVDLLIFRNFAGTKLGSCFVCDFRAGANTEITFSGKTYTISASPAATAHNLLSTTHGDTVSASPVRGDIIVGSLTPTWTKLSKGTQYQTLQGGASDPLYDAIHLDQATAITGNLPIANGGTGTASTLVGLVRGGVLAMTAAELSGDVTTSGSGATTVKANLKIGGFGATFTNGGLALTAGSTIGTQVYLGTIPFACTISAYNININTGTVTFDIWIAAPGGTEHAAVANTIVSSGGPTITTGTFLYSTAVSGWTAGVGLTVAAHSPFAIQLKSINSGTPTYTDILVECDRI